MGFELWFAFIAGIVTVVSPCTLPVIPLLVGSAGRGRVRRVAALVAGFAITFVTITVLLAAFLAALGLTTNLLRGIALIAFATFGAILLVPALGERVSAVAARIPAISGRSATLVASGDVSIGLVFGAAVGLVWAPCTGPLMAAVIAAAVTSGPSADAALVAIAYVAGASVPLAAIALFGQALTTRLGSPWRRQVMQRALGGLMLATAVLVASGLDLAIQDSLAGSTQPAADVATGPTPTTSPGDDGLPARLGQDPGTVRLEDLGPAPDPVGITVWINSGPLTMEQLRGKVVLVHFWTFACINCIHVQPFVKAWYDRYGPAGLEVIGVHTPELSFERDLDNVKEAVVKADVRFPVAFDPEFATWQAYDNPAWPGFYFIDRTGEIRYTYWGEGLYDSSEQVIRDLLSEPVSSAHAAT